MRQLAVLIAAATATVALNPAQAAVKDPYGRGNWTKLVKDKGVQKALGLTDSQAKSLSALPFAKDGNREKITKILEPKQLKTLKRLRWKAIGGYALFEEEVADALALTDSQQEKLAAVAKENVSDHKKMRNFMARARFRSREAMEKFIAGYRTKADQRLLAVLTKDQAAKLKKLVG